MTDITVIGDINVDLLTSPIVSYPKKDYKTFIPYVNFQIGGGSANFCFASSRLGLKTRFIGLIGDDILGEYIERKVKEFKIDSRIRKTDKEKTGITFGIQFEDGSKSLISYRGTNFIFSLKDFKLEEIAGKAIHISGYNFLDKLREGFMKIFSYTKKKNMLTSLDPDIKSEIRFDVEELKRISKKVDIFFINRLEGKLLTGESNKIKIIKKILSFGCKIVALKCGKEGSMVGSGKRIFSFKGIGVRPISPTGAGDIFDAAFVFNYLKTRDIKKAGIFANAAGALSVTKKDEKRFAREKEIIRFLREHER